MRPTLEDLKASIQYWEKEARKELEAYERKERSKEMATQLLNQ